MHGSWAIRVSGEGCRAEARRDRSGRRRPTMHIPPERPRRPVRPVHDAAALVRRPNRPVLPRRSFWSSPTRDGFGTSPVASAVSVPSSPVLRRVLHASSCHPSSRSSRNRATRAPPPARGQRPHRHGRGRRPDARRRRPRQHAHDPRGDQRRRPHAGIRHADQRWRSGRRRHPAGGRALAQGRPQGRQRLADLRRVRPPVAAGRCHRPARLGQQPAPLQHAGPEDHARAGVTHRRHRQQPDRHREPGRRHDHRSPDDQARRRRE